MQRTRQKIQNGLRNLWWALPLLALAFWQRALLWSAVVQLFLGMLVALAVLPLMRRFEKKLPPSLAATLAMTSLSVSLILTLLILLPPLISQGRQIIETLPALYAYGEEWVRTAVEWLGRNGVVIDENMKASFLQKGEELLSGAAMAVVGWLRGIANSVGKWMLAPVFAFYFLRDRRRIGDWLLMLVPAHARALTVKTLKEMRRETAGYLRGQLMVSAIVGALTTVGLLFCGVQAWLLLGVAMGVLELIPYVGPILGGVLVFLFSWQNGLPRLLWTMGVVVLVQQLEGGMLSPQLMSDATRLHPVAVLLCVMLGGAAGGVAGILLAVPLLLCARAVIRVQCLNRNDALYRNVRARQCGKRV